MRSRNSVRQLLVLLRVFWRRRVSTRPSRCPSNGAQGGSAGRRAQGRGGLAPQRPRRPRGSMAEYPVPPLGSILRARTSRTATSSWSSTTRKRLGRAGRCESTHPGYSADRKYPVLYIQHGLGIPAPNGRNGRRRRSSPTNLLADRKIQPMVIVFPAGNATATVGDEKQGDARRNHAGWLTERPSERDHPVRGVHYSVCWTAPIAPSAVCRWDRRALNIGLSHLDLFGWISVVAPAPNSKPVADLIPDPAR